MSPFAGYLFGILTLIAGLAVAAYLLNVPTVAIIVAVVVLLVAIGAWATRPARARPSKFTGATPNSPSLDRTVLMELKTALMERVDAARTKATTRMDQVDDARSQPTRQMDRQTGVSKRPKSTPRDD